MTSTQKLLLAVNIVLVLGFGVYYIQAANYEFAAYAGTIAAIVGVLFSTVRYTKFPSYILAGITIWGALHMLGGSLMTPDGVLYAYRIYPFFDGGGDFYILKMDQVIHAFLYAVVGLMFWHMLREVLHIRSHLVLVAAIAIFASAGFGIINEIIEFWAAMNIPDNGVGGYENTVLDLIFNMAGATIAVSGALLHEWWKQNKEGVTS